MFEDQNSDNRIKNIKIFRHHIPRNQEELEKVKEILRTQDIFDRKLSLIYQKLDQIFKQIDYDKLNVEVWKWITSLNNEMRNLITNLFAIELTKTNYTFNELKTGYPLSAQGRKIPCEICGENRVVEKCHILPNRMGGSLALENIFFLCPLHHKLLDNYSLTQQEFSKLNISDKSPKSIEYFNKVIEPNIKNFWKGQKNKKYDLEKEFRDNFRKEVIEYIRNNQPVDIKKIVKNFVYAYKETEQIIMELRNKNHLIMNKEGRFILKSKKGIL